MEPAAHFDLAMVQSALVGTRFAGKLRHFASINSTNTQLLADVAEGAPEGTVYIADEQTAGRGRGGHTWHSEPAAGLYVSALVRLPIPLREALWISLATGLAARQAIRAVSGLDVDIRWPNDLLLETSRGPRKLGGILVETALEGGALRYAVIGVGINVTHAGMPNDVASVATSLRLECEAERARELSREALLVALLKALDLELGGLEDGRRDLLERFAVASTWVRGKRVTVAEQGGYTGMTDGLDSDGFLRVRADDGSERTVLSGGVREG